jgi:hypothetical protein
MIEPSLSFNEIDVINDNMVFSAIEQPLVTTGDGLNLSGVSVDLQFPPSATELEPWIWEDLITWGTYEDTNHMSANDTDTRPQDSPKISNGIQNPRTHPRDRSTLGWDSLWDDSLVAELDPKETRRSRRASSASVPSWWALLPTGTIAAALSLESDDLEREKKLRNDKKTPSSTTSHGPRRISSGKCEYCRSARKKVFQLFYCMSLKRKADLDSVATSSENGMTRSSLDANNVLQKVFHAQRIHHRIRRKLLL